MNTYKVMTWSGSGYHLNEYVVEGNSEGEAFDQAVDQAIEENCILNFSFVEAQEYFDDLDDDEKEKYENDYFNYFTSDGWEYFASGQYERFICTENLRILELTLDI